MTWTSGLDGLPLDAQEKIRQFQKRMPTHPSLDLDAKVFAALSATGGDWQMRANALLLAAVEQGRL
jgi:uncharacterized protein (DUF4415 family)